MNLSLRSLILPLVAVAAGGHLGAQTLTDIGSSAPTPGMNDISQLSTNGNQTFPDGKNYYTDNNPPAGQTFTTGTNAMKLVSVAIKTAGLDSGGGYGTPASTPTYYLSIYSMKGGTATLLITVSAPNPGFADGDWLKWSGLNVAVATNQTYAFSFGRQPLAVAMRRWPWPRTPTLAAKLRSFPSAAAPSPPAAATSLTRCSIWVCNRRPPIFLLPCHSRCLPTDGTWEIRWRPPGECRILLRRRSTLPPTPGLTPFAFHARGIQCRHQHQRRRHQLPD